FSSDKCVGFDLDLRIAIDQARYFDDGRGGPDLGEDFAVDLGDLFPLADVGDVHAGADDVFDAAAQGFDGGADDRQRAAGLLAQRLGVGAVGVDADAAGDGDPVACAYGAAVTHQRFPFVAR